MKKTIAFLLSTAALAASMDAGYAETKHPVMSDMGSRHYVHHFIRKGKEQTLYDQTGNDEGFAVVSQNFESSFDAYDAQGADDFVVPSNTVWQVHEVDAIGKYFNGYGPAASENVFFYKDKKGRPGNLIHEFTNVSGADDGSGSFIITLPGKGGRLKPGHYWVSVQINMDFLSGGEWGWEKQSTVEGLPAMWQNPGDGFGTGCTTWNIENLCVPGGGAPVGETSGDKNFALKGKIKGGG